MKGTDLKNRLLSAGFTVTGIANKVGVIPQNINGWFTSNDVRTGTIEKLAEVLGLPISFFYGEEAGNIASVRGNNNTTATGNNNTVSGSDDRLLTLLLNKDEQLLLAMKQTSKAQEQTDVVLKMLTEK
jgi:transcriptional regulator with XRE-family HTH domain